jgi:glutamate N-acetyltransferase/amino-acid N-acetyltransferase
MTIDVLPGGNLTMPKGFVAGAVAAGIKTTPGAPDLALLYSEWDCAVAGVFTRNLVKGAPVVVTQERVAAGGPMRALIVNSGVANALNGPGGRQDALDMAAAAASQLRLRPEQVAVASTGVTGVRLPIEKIQAAVTEIQLSPDGGHRFARAIMTTDTRPKEIALTVWRPNGGYTIGGCCKGSGMIHPDMATMLCYVTTDADISPGLLAHMQRQVANETLNMVSIDGDTSCSDSFLIFANGAAGMPPIEEGTGEAALFQLALLQVTTHLAKEIARDGEGAGRLIEVAVRGAASKEDAVRLARTITTSPLVKTAVAGCDANWGRILVAAGRSGAMVVEAKTSMWLQGVLVFDHGTGLRVDDAALQAKMDAPVVRIEIDLGLGDETATAWGCDLTADYVHINADYRT